MGALGRGVLYASLLTAMGVSAVGAAAQESIPGDALHAVKLQLEEVRMRVAPPALRDDLAAMALDERLEEVERLAAAGRWQLVDEAAALAAVAEQQLAGVMATGSGSESGEQASEDAIQRHSDRIEVLIGTAPVSARDSLRRAWQASTADVPPAAAEPPISHPSNGSQPRSDGEQPEDPAQVPDAPVQEPHAPAHDPAAPSKPPSAQR
jgi:hypothetical protein